MFSSLIFSVLWASCLTGPIVERCSYSPAVGSGIGTPFASSGEGRITAVRIWENSNSFIYGIQLRYGYTWTALFGREVGNEVEMELYKDEAIIQVSGKYHTGNYIYQMEVFTNRGRCLRAGQPAYLSFNFYATYSGAELRMLSGRANAAGITALGAHWGTVPYGAPGSGNNTNS